MDGFVEASNLTLHVILLAFFLLNTFKESAEEMHEMSADRIKC